MRLSPVSGFGVRLGLSWHGSQRRWLLPADRARGLVSEWCCRSGAGLFGVSGEQRLDSRSGASFFCKISRQTLAEVAASSAVFGQLWNWAAA